MVDSDRLVDSYLAHVIAVGLAAVGVAGLLAGALTTSGFWFWLFYLLVWGSFLDTLSDDEAFWRDAMGMVDDDSEPEPTPGADPVETLKRRYADGDIDDAEFDARLDRLLDTPDTLAELEAERG
ncbi:SHOCT domain-containing protein [Halosegnis marinus]|uniref:SHOCT domain-containing protein n=1 Tax=Halosegnis marinus TaxID=3034023 RepID=A0ABD5ZR17_9EURY|nr:SHOCT domain-containing protein [Halosegnis sp. DT85]